MNILQSNLHNIFYRRVLGGPSRLVVLCLLPSLLFGCASPAVRVQSTMDETRPTPSTVVYFYPNNNQSEEQQERDRYDCYLWAVEQSGYDPGQQALAPHQRIEVVPTTPPGSDVAVGAATGAVLGSILAGPHSKGGGLVFGILAGTILGLASEAGKQEQAANLQQQYDNLEQQRYYQLEKLADGYRRAISACLEGRDYTVQ